MDYQAVATKAIEAVKAVESAGGYDQTHVAVAMRQGTAMDRYQADRFDGNVISLEVFACVELSRAKQAILKAGRTPEAWAAANACDDALFSLAEKYGWEL